jgi:predicted Ser/Thr protein kinase
MLATDAHLVKLSDDQRQRLETWLVEFDLSWDDSRLASWVRRLPPRDDCLRLPALVEMIKIDLERRWRRGQRANVEAYLKAHPELGESDRVLADLLLAEYEARQQSGATADLADFARRFPQQAEELRRLVAPPPNQAGRVARPASHDTIRSREHDTDVSCYPASSGRPSTPSPAAVTPDQLTPLPERLAQDEVAPPKQLGRYRIVRELGRGAMGTVYLAHDGQLDRLVALKVPQFTVDDDAELRQRFLSEARAAATIEHPNICPVYDVGEINGTPYLTMAYLQGQPLSQLLEGQTPLPEREAAALVQQLTFALQAAHERGIIHRDLKPSNIIINQRREPVILDFGLARRLRQEGARLTQFGQPLGTPAYMSPEQVAGAVGAMGPGCDIYALGVVLYQLLTGRLPFEGAVAEVLAQIVTQPPEPPSKHRPSLDRRLQAICLKALSKLPADRHATMRDLGAALADYLRPESLPVAVPLHPCLPVATPAAGHGVRPQPARLSRRVFWLLLGGGGLVATGAAAVVLFAGLFLWNINTMGTLRIELDGPPSAVEMQVDGERIDSGALNKPLQLRSGRHHLLVSGAKIQQVSTSFTVVPGDNPVLRVQLVPRADAVADPVPRRRYSDDDDDRKPGRRHGDDDDDHEPGRRHHDDDRDDD